jgi:hypothetical protein
MFAECLGVIDGVSSWKMGSRHLTVSLMGTLSSKSTVELIRYIDAMRMQ